MTHPHLADLHLLGDATRRAATYLQGAPGRRVAPSALAIEALRELAGPLPDLPSEPHDVLELLDRIGSPATVVTTAGRFSGFVNGGALPASVAASWMVAAWDQNAALRVMSPAASAFEDVALAGTRVLWFARSHASRHRRSTAGRHVLVRRNRVAGAHGHAD